MKSLFNEDYYERGIEKGISGYTNYRWIPELTIPLAARMIEYLGIQQDDKILDYGCAKGYLVYAFRLLHREAYGYDISDYALSCAPREVESYISNTLDCEKMYDWVIAKDVFEHLEKETLEQLLDRLRKMTKKLFVIVPLGENGNYVVPAYEHDVTHIIREDLDWWKEIMCKHNFKVVSAEYKVRFIKENYANYDKGNGFLVLE